MSAKIEAYIEAKAKAGVGKAQDDLKLLANKAPWFGRVDELIGKSDHDVATGMRAVLKGSGTVPRQLAAHQTFLDKVYSRDWDAKIGAGVQQDGQGRSSSSATSSR